MTFCKSSLVLLALLMVSALLCAAATADDVQLNGTTDAVDTITAESAEASGEGGRAVGAVPEPTDAEKAQKMESQFQTRLAGLTQAVANLEVQINRLHRQAFAPVPGDIENLVKDISVVDSELADLKSRYTGPLNQLQTTDLQDRLFQARMALEVSKQRWGSEADVFGVDFFRSAPLVAKPDQQPAPENYEVRVGDSLRILIVSSLGAEDEYHLTVDTTGSVPVRGAGHVRAAGKTARQIRDLLSKEITSRFKQLRVEVTVENLAAMQIQVAGEVARPGTYVLSGMATVISALYRAGGPTRAGTFRRISLQRNGEAARTIDLYDFLLYGSKKQDLPLQDGDLIFVPTVGETITVSGEVNRPARYEPTFPIRLGAALAMAGSAKSSGYLQTVQVERVENNEYNVLLSEPMANGDGKQSFILQPGDQVTVTSVRPNRTNAVTVAGPVKAPGVFGFKEGMRALDLIKLAQGLATDSEIYGGRADILRVNPMKGVEILTFNLDKALSGDPSENLELHKLDRLFLYDPDQVVFRPRIVTLTGALANPGVYRRTDGMRISDAVAAAAGTSSEAYLTRANLIRYTQGEEKELVKIDLQRALNGDADANILLQDRDQLTVYKHEDVAWRDRTVRVEGAVQRPGTYARSEKMRVSDLLFECGGLVPEAAKTIELSRCADGGSSSVTKLDVATLQPGSETDLVVRDGDTLTVPSVNPAFRNPEIVFIKGEVAHPGPYVLKNQRERLVDLISRAGGVTESADINGALFLRQKEGFENTQQEKDVDIILTKSRLFSDKQFLTQLAKMGMVMPENFAQSGNPARDVLAKPAEVVADQRLEQTPAKTESSKAATDSAIGTQEIMQALSSNAAVSKEPSAMGAPVAHDSIENTNVQKGHDPPPMAMSARISVDLSKALAEPDSADNLSLRDGDQILIPKTTNVVTVIGAVLHPHSFAAGPGRTVDYYIERSGGYSQDASKADVIVVQANGDAMPRRSIKSVKPGDMIVVPTTGLIEVTKKMEKVSSVTKVISEVLSSIFILTRF